MTELDKATRNLDRMAKIASDQSANLLKKAQELQKAVIVASKQ